MTSKVVLVCLLIFLGKCRSINCVYDIPYVVKVLMNRGRCKHMVNSLNVYKYENDRIHADHVYNVNHEQ